MRVLFSLSFLMACRSESIKLNNDSTDSINPDLDGDGFVDDDCDDSNEFINPVMPEVCDGIDNTCAYCGIINF